MKLPQWHDFGSGSSSNISWCYSCYIELLLPLKDPANTVNSFTIVTRKSKKFKRKCNGKDVSQIEKRSLGTGAWFSGDRDRGRDGDGDEDEDE